MSERPAVVARVKRGQLVFGQVVICADYVSCPHAAIAKLLAGETIRLQQVAQLFNLVQRTVEAVLRDRPVTLRKERVMQKVTERLRPAKTRSSNPSYQDKVLTFVREHWRDRGYSPTMREIGISCGINSTSVVAYNLDALEAHGYLTRQENISRSIVLTDKGRAP